MLVPLEDRDLALAAFGQQPPGRIYSRHTTTHDGDIQDLIRHNDYLL